MTLNHNAEATGLEGGLRRKLLRSHFFVALLGAAIILVGLFVALRGRSHSNRLATESAPMALACREVQTGLQTAMAQLRGWLAIADPALRDGRRRTWQEVIEPALDRMFELARANPRHHDLDRLTALRDRLSDLKEWQWYIQEIAHTEGNRPALHYQDTFVQPEYHLVFTLATDLIDLENTLDRDPERPDFLYHFANIRGHLGYAKTSLQKLLTSGQLHHRTEFLRQRQTCEQQFAEVARYLEELDPRQREQFALLTDRFHRFIRNSDEAFRIHESQPEAIGPQWLREHAAPIAREAGAQLEEIARLESDRMAADAAWIARLANGAPWALGAALLLLLATAYLISSRGAVNFLQPIDTLIQSSRQIADGDLETRIAADSSDELELLANALNRMRTSIRDQQDALQVSETKSRMIVDTATDGIVTIDERGIVESFNQGATAIFGYTPEEVIGRNVKMLMPSPYREEHDGYLRGYHETGNRHIIGIGREVTGRRKNGEEFPLYLAVGEARLEGGNIYTGVIRDITDLHQARLEIEERNAALDAQNRKQKDLADLDNALRGESDPAHLGQVVLQHLAHRLHASNGIFFVKEDTGSRYIPLNAYGCKTEPAQMDTFADGQGSIGQAAREGGIVRLQDLPDDYLNVQTATGETAVREILVLPVLFDGKANGVIELGTLHTFSEEENPYLQTAVHQIGMSLEAARRHKRLEALLHQTQQQAEELQAQQEELRVSNEELEAQTQALEESREELQNQQEELRVTNEELEAQKDALEDAKQGLERQAVELAQASQYKSDFLANMSHELRTPLNSLLILAKLLAGNKERNLTEKQVGYAQTIHQGGSDLLLLINDILDLSKVEAGRLEAHWETYAIESLTTSMHRSFDHIADEKGVRFRTEVEDGLPAEFCTDGQRLEQIIRNLLSNAFKFTAQGEVALTIGRASAAEPAGAAPGMAFHVSDTGLGIPRDKLDLIFESFRQVDGSTSRQYGGTGLGLSISREFAHLLGGRVIVESEQGRGSTFTLMLPETPPDTEADARPAEAEAPRESAPAVAAPARRQTVPPAADQQRRLLIVEKDHQFGEMLAANCRERGFDPMVVTDGAAALEWAREERPCAIILDINLADMDGYEVMERLQKHPDTRAIPVHFMSAAEDSPNLEASGALGFIKKPVTGDLLEQAFEKIERVISTSLRKLLVVENDAVQSQSIVELMEAETGDLEIKVIPSAEEALVVLRQEAFDCMILDLGLAGEMSGFDLLERLQQEESVSYPPVIVYTGRDLSRDEEYRLHRFAQSIVVKGVQSPERLLDEASLFLHRVESRMPTTPRKMLEHLEERDNLLTGKTVLIVDDDMRNIFALTSSLEEYGMQVVIGKNGIEGLDRLEDHPEIDLVLMDIMMPEMDGIEAMKRIRSNRTFKELPIIALTAKAMKEDQDECRAAGASDYLSKPVDIDRLISLMRVWLHT